MTARGRMTMRALVQRDNASGEDGFGMKLPRDWQTHIASQACFLYTIREDEIIDGVKHVVLGFEKLLMPLGTDITEDDRLLNIKDRLGVTLIANVMRITSVARRHLFLELSVTEVQ